MSIADFESQHVHRAELLLQAEDCEQILVAYAEQFEEENTLLLELTELERQLAENEESKRNVAASLEVLEVERKQLEESAENERTRFL